MPHCLIDTSEGIRDLNLSEATEHHGGARWSPYDENGGTVLAIAGEDFVVIAGDTRLSTGYSILSRKESKISRVGNTDILIGGPGSHNDSVSLRGMLNIRAQMFEHDNQHHQLTVENTAQLVSNTLYSRRFFPYYVGVVLAGLDVNGKGAVYTYDAVGSHQRLSRGAQGSGQQLMAPLLDNLVEKEMRSDEKAILTLDQTKEILKDAFVTAGERDIYTGDSVEIYTIDKHGVHKEMFQLKAD